jgi:ferredoxin
MHKRLPGGRSTAQLVMAAEANDAGRCAGERGASIAVVVDGVTVTVGAGVTLLDACDAAGRYVPRLCFFPGLEHDHASHGDGTECGLCLVRLGDDSTVLACLTAVTEGANVTTDDHGLRTSRLERLAAILAGHPHVCLGCPDRDGCARDDCPYGTPPEARCCDLLGRCELGRLIAYLDPGGELPRRTAYAARSAVIEGRIRREQGLCVGCGRCVRVCSDSTEAGQALEMVREPAESGTPAESGVPEEGRQPVAGAAAAGRLLARPKRETLRESGCTFCGLCVIVCPTGALTVPGEAGSRWLASRRARHGAATPVLAPVGRRMTIPDDLKSVPADAGIFTLFDRAGLVLRIGGAADLWRGLREALREPTSAGAASFQFELEPLYTQRETELLAGYAHEHGRLPVGNDVGDDLFADEID